MKAFQVIDKIEVHKLHEALLANPELWNKHGDRTRDGSPHNDVDDIWVRYNAYEKILADREHANDEHVPVWYPAHTVLAPVLMPIINKLMAGTAGEMLGGVLITRVPAGKKVLPHVDKGWHVDYYDKFYVQITGDYGCDFCCEKAEGGVEEFTPMPGDVYRFDNRQSHWVNNNSKTDRITLIVCIRTHLFERKI